MMNKGLIFAGGTLLGGVIGFAIGYLKAAKNFNNALDDYEIPDHIPDKYLRKHFEKDDEETKKSNVSENHKDLEEIKKKLTNNWDATTNYAAAYDLAQDEKPDDEEIYEEEMLGNMDEETTDFLKKHENKKPKIISETALGELPPGIDNQCLFYWQYDDTLTTEDDEEIEDAERFLGDALTKYGFSDNEEKTLYVINYELGTVYEIEKIEKAFHTEN